MAKRVLVIDDHRDSLEAMRTLLELNGYEVQAADDGESGIEMARVFFPDVIVCDIAMPGLDGLTVARTLRSDPRLHSVRLIAFSAFKVADTARSAGFDASLLKCERFDRLLALL
jgi:two-component system, OmpR family, response regulator